MTQVLRDSKKQKSLNSFNISFDPLGYDFTKENENYLENENEVIVKISNGKSKIFQGRELFNKLRNNTNNNNNQINKNTPNNIIIINDNIELKGNNVLIHEITKQQLPIPIQNKELNNFEKDNEQTANEKFKEIIEKNGKLDAYFRNIHNLKLKLINDQIELTIDKRILDDLDKESWEDHFYQHKDTNLYILKKSSINIITWEDTF
eukprot:TRINITY_DN3762_c0_g1_i1.p1 TRINITY_DN3762_c0_g1~~TRINITY_DN3762_c0_g1_i1.p1  ORF type:complete len:206 (-),score=42.63 TRINITY_DN3762_c0_g1_i1:133-750(-)